MCFTPALVNLVFMYICFLKQFGTIELYAYVVYPCVLLLVSKIFGSPILVFINIYSVKSKH